MGKLVNLKTLKISNYLGYKYSETVHCDNKRLVLVGKNNSGKSSTVSALSFLKKVCHSTNFITETGSGGYSRKTLKADWSKCELATPDIFHGDSENAEITLAYELSPDDYDIQKILASLGREMKSTVKIEFTVEFKPYAARLKSLYADEFCIFKSHATTTHFAWQGIEYLVHEGVNFELILTLPKNILSDVLYFPSTRTIRTSQGDNSHDSIASGATVLQWIQDATNADARDAHGRLKQKSLAKFKIDFAKFIGAKSVELAVNKGAFLNLTVDGRFTPIENLGTGISECLLILLASRVAKDTNSTLHTLILEEPELHLHPQMQRQLIQLLLLDGLNLVLTTHSSTILNEMIKESSNIYHTVVTDDGFVNPKAALTTHDVRSALDDIGASAADILHAEKVLWVEGPTDVPVFREWIKKCPEHKGQNIAVVPMGGDLTGVKEYDFKSLSTLNPNMLIILDSERETHTSSPKKIRSSAQTKCREAGVPLWLTERRCTENYYTPKAVTEVYPDHPEPVMDHYKIINHPTFSKSRGHLVASAMDWNDIKDTDIGVAISKLLKGANMYEFCFPSGPT